MVRQRSQQSPTTKTSQAISPSPQQTFQASEPRSTAAPKNPDFQGLSSELSMPIQAKLTVGEPNDKYEQEADRVAAQVVQQIHAQVINQSVDDSIQRKTESPNITPLKISSLQRKNTTEENAVSSGLESSINQARGTGKPLPHSLRPKMENAFGSDLSNVRIHNGARADKLSRSIQANAFTTGQDIFFRGGAYKPESYGGQQLIAHELTHVAQQQTGTQLVQRDDAVEDAVLKGRNKKQLKRDLASCVAQFKAAIQQARDTIEDEDVLDELNEGLAEKGRDAFFYRRIWWKNKHGLEGDLNRWKSSWSVARTGGLLADLGLVLKDVPLDSFTSVGFDEISNDYLQTGSNHVRKRRDREGNLIAERSDWYDHMMSNDLKVNAGPSSTSTQLLTVAASIGTFEKEEVEAMMVALVTFWKGKLKRQFGGGYHTAVEVWAPYTGYLESQE